MQSVNPATGEVLERYADHGQEEVEERIERAATLFRSYRRTSFQERADRMRAAADLLEADKGRLGRLMSLEMGKTITSAMAEAEKCARACRFYAQHAEAFLADEEVQTDAPRSFVRYRPLGPVLGVMPWNFPFWQVFRFAAPALMAGNVCLLKHASNVPGCALEIEALWRRAGFPPGAFQTLLVGSGVIREIIADPRVAAVTFTGSDNAGAQVGEAAGRAVKKVVLELGGSDPFIVMPSADLAAAARTAVAARCINNGQSCIAAKRFIVHERVYSEFEQRMQAGLEALKMGDPLCANVDLGPLATRQGQSEVERQVADSVKAGARILTGGKRTDGPGWFYPPTLLADIPRDAPAYREEVFGPVALLFRASDIEEAVALANDSPYGLASSVWTKDPAEIERFANDLEVGATFANAMVASDPRLPFGGVKHSGHGRELGIMGIREFMNAKAIAIH
ncbi:MAG TPA: NAD-dependent succinate-semialdehyde dehydrogenase [Anaeromyxobacteraceae bacterium]|nr:NAD-dependent succinate-semialdehyde dehydrogenase [Anaeromyxobacteraceae bacterium]